MKLPARSVVESILAQTLANHPLKSRPERVKPDVPSSKPYQGVWRQSLLHMVGGVSVTDRVLVIWSAGKQRLDDQKRKRHLKRLLDDLTNIQPLLNVRHYKRRAYVEQRSGSKRYNSVAIGPRDWSISN